MIHQRSALHRLSVITAIIVALILFLLIFYNETAITKGKPIIYISSSSKDAVIKSLDDAGYELNGMDRFVLNFVTLPKAGWYSPNTNETNRFSFLRNLYKNYSKTIRIKVFAGETSSEIFHRLARDMKLSQAKLEEYHKELARFKEGNILAGRYSLARFASEEIVMRQLLEDSYTEIDFFMREEFGSDFSATQLREALIIASIIQRESNDAKEMPHISSVIHNRLKKNMRLQMDGTLNYGKYSRTIVTPKRIRTDKSRYNTYKYKGLIPDPLGSVSMEALQAATQPIESSYLFFMLNKNGKHNFAETYKEHLKNVKVFKTYIRDRDEKKRLAKEKEKERIRENKRKKEEEKKKREKEKEREKEKKREAKQSIPEAEKTIEKKVNKVEKKKEIKVEEKKELQKKTPKKSSDNNMSHIQKLFSEINATRE